MPEYKVIEASKDEDLGEFSRFLWQQGVSHRVVSDNDRQYLLVGNVGDAQRVARAYQSLKEGELQWFESGSDESQKVPFLRIAAHLPVTLITIVLSILGFLCVKFDDSLGLIGQLTFFEIEAVGRRLMLRLPQGEYWRFITPIFIHFTFMHIVFNMLWLWDLGKRVEFIQGSSRLLGIIFVIGLGSNLAQAFYADPSLFGGMSGVIYGLLGYGWVWSQLVPHKSFHIPNPIVIFMLVWLVVCMTGFTQLIGQGAVANAAHVGGLLMGVIIGLGAALIEKRAT